MRIASLPLEQHREAPAELPGGLHVLEGEGDGEELEGAVDLLQERELDLQRVLPPVRLGVVVDEPGELDDPPRGLARRPGTLPRGVAQSPSLKVEIPLPTP